LFSAPAKESKYKQKESYTTKSEKTKSILSLNSKKRRVTQKKSFLVFNKKDKRDRQNSSYDTKTKATKGSYEYDAKKKRVVKNKSLFRQKKKREIDAGSFKGTKMQKFRYNVFNKHKKRTVHRHSIFRKKTDNRNKKRKLEHDLFNPRMKIII